MRTSNTDSQHERDMATIDVWENEGGAPGRHPMEHQYGRRIEADRSWTVYHVFSGIPARADGNAMIGLSHSDATNCMTYLNLRNVRYHKERIRLPTLDQSPLSSTEEFQS